MSRRPGRRKPASLVVYDATARSIFALAAVDISMAGQSKSPAGLLLPKLVIQVLSQRANVLCFGATNFLLLREVCLHVREAVMAADAQPSFHVDQSIEPCGLAKMQPLTVGPAAQAIFNCFKGRHCWLF